MNNRIVIISALLATVIAHGAQAQTIQDLIEQATPQSQQLPPLDKGEAKKLDPNGVSAAPVRLPKVTGLGIEPAKYGGPPATLGEARARARQRLADLENMTEEQWRDEQYYKATQRSTWDMLSRQQKQMVFELGRQGQGYATERLPEIEDPATLKDFPTPEDFKVK